MDKDLLKKFVEGRCTPEEVEYLTELMQSDDPGEFDSLMYDEWKRVEDDSVDLKVKHETWKSIEATLDLESGKKSVTKTWLKPILMAASLVLLIGLAWFFDGLLNPKYKLIHNRTKEAQEIILSDGSSLWLKQGGSVRYREGFKKNGRGVTLNGEAYFEIVHDSERPFVVSHNGFDTRVLGTTFNIKTGKNGKSKVSLFEGSVKVEKDDQDWMLIPGEELKYSVAEDRVSIQKFDLENNNILAWKTGVLKFNNRSLSNVLRELESHYGLDLKYSEDELLDKYITCEVGFSENIDQALEIVLFPHKMKFIKSNDNIIIVK